MKAERYESLDGLRGVCALFVVFSHFVQIYPSAWTEIEGPSHAPAINDPLFWLLTTPLNLAISGKQAVMVFFVLSGFVLSLTFERSDGRRYAPYIVKRFMRIWPPFAFSILAAAILVWFIKPMPINGLSEWFNKWLWKSNFSAKDLLNHLLMLDGIVFLNPPGWSLVHELRISAIMPAIYYCLNRKPTLTCGLLFLIGISASVALDHIHNKWAMTIDSTMQYIYLFCFGGLIYNNIDYVRTILSAKRPVRIMLWCFAVAIFWISYIIDPLAHQIIGKILPSIGAVLLVILLLCPGIPSQLMTTRPIAWLGKISYSLYLIHLPITLAIFHIASGRAPIFLLLCFALLFSLVASWLMNLYIEQPMQGFGRKLSKVFVPVVRGNDAMAGDNKRD